MKVALSVIALVLLAAFYLIAWRITYRVSYIRNRVLFKRTHGAAITIGVWAAYWVPFVWVAWFFTRGDIKARWAVANEAYNRGLDIERQQGQL